jgi:hypothetical protein
MMRTSLLPKVPTRALTPKINNATQSVTTRIWSIAPGQIVALAISKMTVLAALHSGMSSVVYTTVRA